MKRGGLEISKGRMRAGVEGVGEGVGLGRGRGGWRGEGK